MAVVAEEYSTQENDSAAFTSLNESKNNLEEDEEEVVWPLPEPDIDHEGEMVGDDFLLLYASDCLIHKINDRYFFQTIPNAINPHVMAVEWDENEDVPSGKYGIFGLEECFY